MLSPRHVATQDARQRLDAYQYLLYLLQTEPKLFAMLLQNPDTQYVPRVHAVLCGANWAALTRRPAVYVHRPFVEQMVGVVLNQGSSTREEGLLVKVGSQTPFSARAGDSFFFVLFSSLFNNLLPCP